MIRLFILGLLSLAVVATGSAQSPASIQQGALPDFDVRESAAPEIARLRAESIGVVQQRTAALANFVRTPEESRLGTRIVSNSYGLPKLYLRDGHSLSGPSALAPTDIAKGFLRSQSGVFAMNDSEIQGLRVLVDDATDNARFVAFNQTVDGVDVFNAQIKFTLNKNGEVIQVATGDVVPALQISTTPRLSPEDAVKAALKGINSDVNVVLSRTAKPDGKIAFVNPRGAGFSPISTELSIFPMSASSARLAYRIFLENDKESWYELLVDAETGALLFRHNVYTYSGQARVWTQSPSTGTRTLVTFPDGWTAGDGSVTTGNNVDAYLDANGDDSPDSVNNPSMKNGRALATGQIFDFPFGDGTVQMDPRAFQASAVTNLFYFINVAHDYYYNLGFNETSGNFQTDNMGKGGLGNDAVLAEAQQSKLTNNAAFAPTPEGIGPKIRMGLFTRGTTSLIDDLDSDYDGQVVIHEYGHGVSNRLVGAKTSVSCLAKMQSGALGEGWSDYFSISFFNNPVEGGYISQNSAVGIRRYSYEGYPLTYEDIGTGKHGYEVHDDGEIWTGTLWDLRKTLGQTVTDQLVLDGLRSTPCNPSMTDARDGILAADQADNNGANRSAIWTVFARHGMGYSALGVDGTILTGTRYDAAYDMPPDLQPGKNLTITSNPLLIHTNANDLYQYPVTATNPAAGTLNFALSRGPSGMTVDPASGLVTWTAAFVSPRVKITVTDGMGGKVVHGYALPIVTQLSPGVPVSISGDSNSTGYATIKVPSNTPILQVTIRGGSGTPALVAISPDGFAAISERNGPTQTLSWPNPKAGQWQILGGGVTAYSGVSLTASLITPPVLGFDSTLSGLSGDTTSENFYRISVPSGATSLSISTSGGTGDVDLFLQKGAPATCQESLAVLAPCDFDQVSDNDGNAENITVTNPPAGDWYLDLEGYDQYSGVTLNVTTTVPALTVSSGGSLAAITPGIGSTVSTGYATATTGGVSTPFATAVFSLARNGAIVSEAGIPASPPTSTARIFIDYRTGVATGTGTINIRTGLAIVNPGNSPANLTLTLRDINGQTITTGHGQLPAGAHRSRFIDELNLIAPDFNLPATFSTSTLYGSLEIASTQPVSVLALRLTTNQRGDTLLTSTPVADLTRPQTTSPVYFSQLANGGGFTTSLVLLNTSSSTESGTIALFSDDGSPLVLQPVGGASGSSFSYSIPAAGSFVLQTDGSLTTTQVGWVRVTPNSGSNAPVGAGVFSYSPAGILITESGVPSAVPTTEAHIYVDKSNGHDTGIALVNPGNTASGVTVSAYQTDGVTAAGTSQTVNVAAGGHKAAFAGELVTGLSSGFKGVAKITSSSPFVALTLRSLTNSRGDVLLTTFPVADPSQTAPSPIVFPQIADGSGFTTQFIFISATGAASVSVTFNGDDGSPLSIGLNQ
jgi:Zn-dependent metalloprotease